jgi:hypothetical protein
MCGICTIRFWKRIRTWWNPSGMAEAITAGAAPSKQSRWKESPVLPDWRLAQCCLGHPPAGLSHAAFPNQSPLERLWLLPPPARAPQLDQSHAGIDCGRSWPAPLLGLATARPANQGPFPADPPPDDSGISRNELSALVIRR